MKSREHWLNLAGKNAGSKSYKQQMDELAAQGIYPKEWTDEHLADFICFEETGEHLFSTSLDKPPETPKVEPRKQPAPIPVEGIDDSEVEKRMAEYLEKFEEPMPQDTLLLKQLCRYELSLDKLNKRYSDMLTAKPGTYKTAELRAMSMQLASLTTSCMDIQKTLGIDKISRGTEQDAGVKLMDYAREARRQLQREGVPIICPQCARGEDARIFQFGFIVWHFVHDEKVDTWSFGFTCPVCHTNVVVDDKTVDMFRSLAGWHSK